MVATVPTTAGEVDVEDLGVVLMHEHMFIRTEPRGSPARSRTSTHAPAA